MGLELDGAAELRGLVRGKVVGPCAVRVKLLIPGGNMKSNGIGGGRPGACACGPFSIGVAV